MKWSKLLPQFEPEALSREFIERAIANPLENETCMDFHGGQCNLKMLSQFIVTFQSMHKMYLVVHLVPFILFKTRKALKSPVREILRLVIGFFKSMLFAAGYTAMVRRWICWFTKYYRFSNILAFFSALFSGFTLIFEPTARQVEISLYCVNKALQTAYNMALRRKLPVRVPGGECLLAGVAIAIICYNYVYHRDAIRGNYLSILDRLQLED